MSDPGMWHPLEIDPLVDNQYASTWGGVFYYDSQDWILILALGIVIIVVLVCVWWYWSRSRREQSPLFAEVGCLAGASAKASTFPTLSVSGCVPKSSRMV